MKKLIIVLLGVAYLTTACAVLETAQKAYNVAREHVKCSYDTGKEGVYCEGRYSW